MTKTLEPHAETQEPRVNLTKWEVEDTGFWNSVGRRVANRNLWISIPCLLCAFAVWGFWSIITAEMQKAGIAFSADPSQNKELLYTLMGIAGLSGATLRIPNSFFIALSGGRNVIAVTTALLILPSLGVGIALQDPDTPFGVYAVLAVLSGIGGGAFASSMSNISFFFPKRMQGLSLGLNAGLGNVGVSVMQLALPLAVAYPLFGALSGGARYVVEGSSRGEPVWIQNCGLVWVPILAFLALLAWFRMNNLARHEVQHTGRAIGRMLWLLLLGMAVAGVGVWLLEGIGLSMWLVLPLAIVGTVLVMRYLAPGSVRRNLSTQYDIFKKKHNWVMTWLYTMTFGSFIGYSFAFPKLIQDVFGYLPGGAVNPDAPDFAHYAWLGPLVGSLVRPLGGWLSDRFGGARVTHWDTVVMIAATAGVAWCVKEAGASTNPETWFLPFLLFFLLLFVTTGIGNGSTFRMVPFIFEKDKAGPVLGWISAVAAYGAFIIPRVFGQQIKAGTPELALYGFGFYYVSCLAVNWWYYARRNAEIRC